MIVILKTPTRWDSTSWNRWLIDKETSTWSTSYVKFGKTYRFFIPTLFLLIKATICQNCSNFITVLGFYFIVTIRRWSPGVQRSKMLVSPHTIIQKSWLDKSLFNLKYVYLELKCGNGIMLSILNIRKKFYHIFYHVKSGYLRSPLMMKC